MIEMTNEEAVRVIENELRCVQRAATNCCDRECDLCPLVMDDEVIVKAYGMSIKSLEKLDNINAIIHNTQGIQEDVIRYKMICEVMEK